MINLLKKAVNYVKENAKFEWGSDEDYEELFASLDASYDADLNYDDSSDDSLGDSGLSVNPTTGLPMAGGVDIGGNPYGT